MQQKGSLVKAVFKYLNVIEYLNIIKLNRLNSSQKLFFKSTIKLLNDNKIK